MERCEEKLYKMTPRRTTQVMIRISAMEKNKTFKKKVKSWTHSWNQIMEIRSHGNSHEEWGQHFCINGEES